MLAYVFWHRPSAGVDRGAYERRLDDFHRALAEDPAAGFSRSTTFRLDEAVLWFPTVPAYEDWYLVDSFEALGELNTAAVSGSRRPPHDLVAADSADGAGGLYVLARGEPDLEARYASWLAKPQSVSYRDFAASLPAGDLWIRQLVLGPGLELCLHTTERLEIAEATTVELSRFR